MRWVLGSLFALLALLYLAESPSGSLALLTLAILFLAFYGRLNRWWYVRHNLRLNAGRDGPRLGTTKLGLVSGKLLVEAPEGSSKLELSAIRRIDASHSHFFLYLGPVSALIVPRAGDEAEAFIQALRSACAAA
jgi:hypothetical protein